MLPHPTSIKASDMRKIYHWNPWLPGLIREHWAEELGSLEKSVFAFNRCSHILKFSLIFGIPNYLSGFIGKCPEADLNLKVCIKLCTVCRTQRIPPHPHITQVHLWKLSIGRFRTDKRNNVSMQHIVKLWKWLRQEAVMSINQFWFGGAVTECQISP